MSKRKRDPDAPKRAMSAYFCFTADVRAETKAELGDGAKITDIAKAMGAKWKKMSDKEKAPYQKKADKDKKRYEKEKAKYDKSGKAEKWAAANPPTSGKKKRKKARPSHTMFLSLDMVSLIVGCCCL